MPGHRLTLTSGVPVTTSDVTAAGTLYYAPYTHDRIALYTAARGWHLPFRAIDTAGDHDHLPEIGLPHTLTNAKNYDVFAFANEAAPSSTDTGTDTLTFGSDPSWQTGACIRPDATGGGLTKGTAYWYRRASATTGTLHATLAGALANTGKVDLTATITATLHGVSLELSAAWTTDTARADALGTQDGVSVKSGAATRLWIGTLRASGTNTTEDSLGGTSAGGKRFLYNAYNQVWRDLVNLIDPGSHTYNSATVREWNNGTSGPYRVSAVFGGAVDLMLVGCRAGANAAAGSLAVVTARMDSIGGTELIRAYETDVANIAFAGFTTRIFHPGLGYHEIIECEHVDYGGGTCTFYHTRLYCAVLQ